MSAVDKKELETKVKEMYRAVAQNPNGEFHFEMERKLAEKLGYPTSDLDQLPREAIDSFAGVGYYFDLANIQEGEYVLDLGSGSGMDVFFAALKTEPSGRVVGVDMTDAQLEKAEVLRTQGEFQSVSFRKGYIEALLSGRPIRCGDLQRGD